MITTALNGAARITIGGYLAASYFKETVFDPTYKLIYKTEKVSFSVVAFNVCLETAILILASDKAARTIISGGIKWQKPAPMHDSAEPNPPLTGDNVADIPASLASSPSNTIATDSEAFSNLPITSTAPRTLVLTLTPKPKRFSLDSDTTVVTHDDFVKDVSGHDSEDAKDRECHDNGSTFREDDVSSNLPPGTKAITSSNPDGPSRQSQPLILVDTHQTSANPDLAPPGSARPIEASRTMEPRLKPPDTKRTNGLLPHLHTTLPHQRSHPGKYKDESRASRLIVARDSIARSRLKQATIMIG
ncbi:uncharacterized protein EDB91DRAFT_107458 [Suillus paluster]|uniref:uncharacterized protein n=1 Tax=Suillus paluster TaxID=48578 RepID=UPI001B86BBC8|nr:uncharacterized protein EDB91DRAFT_107458 [Suillus paluster]KAG1746665.1 hypothetical protein EDB91DRAFT_107458 [Suillus paluster]